MKPKTNRKGEKGKSSSYDQCQTPPYALDPLLPYLSRDWTYRDPCCGDGKILRTLWEKGIRCIGTDILLGEQFDFFTYNEPWEWDCIVTNPPYSIKYAWIARCYELGKSWALLLPVETMGAAKAQRLFDHYGVEVIWLSRRVNFKMPEKGYNGHGAQFPTAWFTWGLSIGREMTFAELNPRPDELEGEICLPVTNSIPVLSA